MKGQGFAKRVTLESLATFRALLRSDRPNAGASEINSEENAANKPNADTPEFLEAEALFQGESIRVRLPFTRRRKPRAKSAKKQIGVSAQTATKKSEPAKARDIRAVARGPVLWRKKLAASDCERQPGHGTGGVRLTQSKFEIGSQKIDQTTYFRAVFSNFAWETTREMPFVEEARVEFHITIKGREFGVHTLAISHKPSGEAGQRNYTTILKWTGMAKEVRKLNLTGSEFILYGPAIGTLGPFFIEIRRRVKARRRSP